MERHDYEKATTWPDTDLKDTAAHLAEQLRDQKLYPKGSERREQIAKHMSLVAFEEWCRYNEPAIDEVRSAGWHNYDGEQTTVQEAAETSLAAETTQHPPEA